MTSLQKFVNARNYKITPSFFALLLKYSGLIVIASYLTLNNSIAWALLLFFPYMSYRKYRQLLLCQNDQNFTLYLRFMGDKLMVIKGEHPITYSLADINVWMNRWFVYIDTGDLRYLLLPDSFHSRFTYAAFRREFLKLL